MRKALKVSGIVLLTITALLVLAAGLASWLLLSRSGLRKTVSYAIEKYSPCRAELGDIKLSITRTFPHIGLTINDAVAFCEPGTSPSDTLASIGNLTVQIDFDAYRNDHTILVEKVFLSDVSMFVFKDSAGTSNLDVFSKGDGNTQDESAASGIPDSLNTSLSFDLKKLKLDDISIKYIDNYTHVESAVDGFCAELSGILSPSLKGNIDAVFSLDGASLSKYAGDSLAVSVADLGIEAKFDAELPSATGTAIVRLPSASLSMPGLDASIDNVQLGYDGLCNVDSSNLDGVLTLSLNDVRYACESMVANAGNTHISTKLSGSYTLKDIVDIALDGSLDDIRLLTAAEDSISLSLQHLDLNVNANGNISRLDGSLSSRFGLQNAMFSKGGESPLRATATELGLELPCVKSGSAIDCTTRIYATSAKLKVKDEEFIQDWPLKVSIPLYTDTSFTHFRTEGSSISINGQDFGLSALCSLDGSSIDASGSFSFSSLDINTLMGMIPASFQHLTDGIAADGRLSLNADGSILYKDGLLDIRSAGAKVMLDDFSGSLGDSISGEADRIVADIDCIDKNRHLKADAEISGLSAVMDTISAEINHLNISGEYMASASEGGRSRLMADLVYDSVSATLGDRLELICGNTAISATAAIDTTQQYFLTRWQPDMSVSLNGLSLTSLSVPLVVPTLSFDFSLGQFDIAKSRIIFGNSDISLSGDIRDIDAFIEHRGTMEGTLDFVSEYTDMDELMSFISGAGREEPSGKSKGVLFADTIEISTDTLSKEYNKREPFIVPEGMNIALNTSIHRMSFNGHEFNNLGGDITIKDGVLVLQELGFSSSAARMELTAIYRTPRTDHLYTGLDFHLLDISVGELIDLIPSVDSIVPMLKSFDGKAQFHLAAETYMDENYMPKMPTLIGAAAIEGKDMKVMDNEVFNTIKKKLLMSRKAENRIDSLSVEIQVLRNKVDLYPFLVHLDRYTAVIGGRHNINKDLDCNYHISLIDTPLPIRLGVNIGGALADISQNPIRHIKLSKCLYDKTFMPDRKNATDQMILEMKSAISETLKGNVKSE
ncbi:MAG: AsmA family protein [Bacteroidaceae bacterium]|nr:AsmA family protein [Bacteroidaceae bacterium]